MKTSLLSWSMVLVATALVACGDDTSSTTGAGGEGGTDPSTTSTGTPTSSSSGNNTTTSSSGNPTSTASTSSGEQGGGGNGQGGEPGEGGGGNGQGGEPGEGGGGNGQGGDNGCVDLVFEDILPQGGGTFIGTVTPALGGAGDDFGVIAFVNNEHTVDLSTTDPATADDIVFAGEDFDEKLGYAAAYASNGGTLTVSEDGWSIEGVTLLEIDLETGAFIEDGLCFNVADASGEVEEPFGWLCNIEYYDAADGCDCECGLPDPDCDLPDQDLFGCQDGQTCSATGECEGVPDAWECNDAQYEDGTTCNCECGAIDPDCDGVNEVEGCTNATDQCIQDTCVPAEETGLCDDLTDNDADGSFDCADDDCSADCTPGAGPRDSLCDANTDCASNDGDDPLCIDFNGGPAVCTEWCTLGGDDCGAGAVCGDIGVQDGACFTVCDPDGDDCPADFSCLQVTDTEFGCITDEIPIVVPGEWVCDPTFYGTDDGCDCGCGALDLDCADANDTSCGFCSADSCGNDGSLLGCDLALIVDNNNAECL